MTTLRPVLLTMSGTIEDGRRDEIAAGRRPRADYFELAAAMDADIVDFSRARRLTGRLGRIVGRLAGDDVVLALACWRSRKRYRVVFTDGERVGLLFAALSRVTPRRSGAAHVMIGHRLSPPKKVLVHRVLGLGRRIDRVVVYATAQAEVAVDRLGYRPDQVVLTPFMVDTEFWRPDAGSPPDQRARPMICAVGQELRDYRTLVDAVRDLPVDLVIAAGSPWSKRKDDSAGAELPANVEVVKFDQFELRRLYAGARFVVVPVVETDFQAGITTILEAMSMGLAAVCSKTAGQTDTITDDVTGRYVPPGDAHALRTAITDLLDSPDDASRLGGAARAWAVANADIDVYATRLGDVVSALSAGPSRRA